MSPETGHDLPVLAVSPRTSPQASDDSVVLGIFPRRQAGAVPIYSVTPGNLK